MVISDAHTSFSWRCGYTLRELVHVEDTSERGDLHAWGGPILQTPRSPSPFCHRIFCQCRGFLTPASTAQGNSRGAILGPSGLCKISSPSFLLPLANQVSHAQSRPNSLSLLVLLSVRETWIILDQTKCTVLILAPESSKDWQQVFSAPFNTGISSTFSVLLLGAA